MDAVFQPSTAAAAVREYKPRTVGEALANFDWKQPNEKIAARALAAEAFDLLVLDLTGSLISRIVRKWPSVMQDPDGYSQNARKAYAGALRRVLNRIGAPRGAFEGIPRLKTPAPRNVTATDEEFDAVMCEADPRLRLLMLCARDAGLRVSSTCNLTPECMSTRADGVRIIEGRAKAGASFEVPLTERLMRELEYACTRTKPGQTFMAAWSRNGSELTRTNITTMMKRAKRKAGVTAKWTIHDLRRTAARRVYAETGDVNKAQRFLGHRSTHSTLWYLQDPTIRLEKDEIERALAPRKRQS